MAEGMKFKSFGISLGLYADPTDSEHVATVRGFFTSDDKDEVGDIITKGATERAIPKYRRWGNIRYMHLPKPVGKITRIGLEDGLDWNEVEIRVLDPEAVFAVKNGLVTALSVGILIKFEDVDFLEDGGLVINDYQLVEISLVDHPANYDAMLTSVKDLPSLVKDANLVEVLRKLLNEKDIQEKRTVKQEKNMEKETIILADESPAEEELEKDLTLEVPAVEVAVEESVSEAVEEPVSEVVEAEPVVEDQSVDDEPSPTPAVEELSEEAGTEDIWFSFVSEISDLKEMLGLLIKELKVPAEVAPVVEQPEYDGLDDELKALETEVMELKEQNQSLICQLEAMTQPVESQGAVPETVLPEESADGESKNASRQDGLEKLRDGIRRSFHAKS